MTAYVAEVANAREMLNAALDKLEECEAINPDPRKFKVIFQKNLDLRWGDYLRQRSILLVQYEGCTTFDGHKLLLLNRIWTGADKLDPHLLGDGNVIACFEPNAQGLAMAVAAAQVEDPGTGSATLSASR